MTRILRLWRGELPLIQAFWDWALIGGIIVNGLSTVLFFALLMHDQALVGLLAGYLVSVPYNTLVTVGVWRSADRYTGDRRNAVWAKTITAVGLTILSVT